MFASGLSSVALMKFTDSETFSNCCLIELFSTKGKFLILIQDTRAGPGNFKDFSKMSCKIRYYRNNYHEDKLRQGKDGGRISNPTSGVSFGVGGRLKE